MGTVSTTTPLSLLTRHWRGHAGLFVSVVFVLLGLRFVLIYLQDFVPASPALLLIGFCLLANGLVLVWQVGGTLRATEKHLTETGDMIPAMAGYFAVLVVVVLTLGQLINAAVALYPEEITYTPPAPDGLIFYSAGDVPTITLEGDIDYRLNTAFIDMLADHPDVQRVVLSSDGGHIFAARAIALNIRRLDLDTHVESACRSACTIAFMAGAGRTLGPQGSLGFHQYGMDMPQRVATVNYREEEAKDRATFAAKGVAAGFLDRAFATAHTEMWMPDRAELVAAGVLTSD